MGIRVCTRTGCKRTARATLTFSYVDSTVVVGPLAPERELGAYDLCEFHSQRMSAPQGWEVIRLPLDPPGLSRTTDDELKRLADEIRRAAGITPAGKPIPASPREDTMPPTVVTLARKGHLRVVADAARAEEQAAGLRQRYRGA